MRKALILVFSVLFLLAIFAIGGIGFVFWKFGRDLPDYQQLATYTPPITTRLYAGDGRLMTEYAVEKRIFVPLSAIPRQVVNAFIATEDKNFYNHWGIDLQGLLRAFLTNLRNLGLDRRPVGASTITQQVAKNFLLTNEVSYTRKIKEAILTLRIEQAFSKDHILELYLNENYFGFGAYGVASAALNYFNKSLDQLNLAETAYLAAVLKAPINYHPILKHDAAITRRNTVIRRMLEEGYISEDDAQAAMKEELIVRTRDETQYVQGGDYFAEEVRRELASAFGSDALYKGGLAVRTTLDPRYQKIADTALFQGLADYDRRHGWRGALAHLDTLSDWAKTLAAIPSPPGTPGSWRLAVVLDSGKNAHIGFPDGSTATIPFEEVKWAAPHRDKQRVGTTPNSTSDVFIPGDVILVEATQTAHTFTLRQIPDVNGALVVMDPHTGRVLAMTGGISQVRSEFNRATQALRQPGSVFKPFVYLTALENGYTPSSIILDAPFVYDQGPGLPKWTPKNYGGTYAGPSTLRSGLEKSRNLMTVRLANSVGINKIAETAQTFGIDAHFPRVLAASLGAGETTPLRMTTAYAMLANGGKRLTPTLIDRVQDRNGKTIYRHDSRPCPDCNDDVFWTGQEMPLIPDTREQIADPRSVYQIVHILEGVVQRGTARRVASLGVPLAAKTGTSNDSVDTWFIGFTPDLVVGVFVGFDEPRTLGARETGSTAALPIFKIFMEEALKGQPVRPFPIPKGISLVRVNHATGALAQPGDHTVISEAFKTGNFPGLLPEVALDGSDILHPGDLTYDDTIALPDENGGDTLPPDGTPLPWSDGITIDRPFSPPQAGGLY